MNRTAPSASTSSSAISSTLFAAGLPIVIGGLVTGTGAVMGDIFGADPHETVLGAGIGLTTAGVVALTVAAVAVGLRARTGAEVDPQRERSRDVAALAVLLCSSVPALALFDHVAWFTRGVQLGVAVTSLYLAGLVLARLIARGRTGAEGTGPSVRA